MKRRKNEMVRNQNLDFYDEEKRRRQRITVILISVVGLLFLAIIAMLLGDFLKSTEEKRQAEYEASEAYAGEQAVAEGERERAKYPVIAGLPVNNALYSVGYQFSKGGDELTVRVRATNTYMNQAVERLKSIPTEGRELSAYNIEFSDYNNYLSAPAESDAAEPVKYLVEAYAQAEVECTIYDGAIEGEYYYTKMTTGNAAHYDLVTYRVVLMRDGETWKFAGTPEPILTIYNTPGVPEEILNKVNNY